MRRRLARMWKAVKWRSIKLSFLLWGLPTVASPGLGDQPQLGPFERVQPRQLDDPRGDQPFDAEAVLHGTFVAAGDCTRSGNRLWVEVDAKGDCIRYYAFGLLPSDNPRALVYLGGDVMLRTSKGVRFIAASYTSRSPATIEKEMAEWSEAARIPAIFLARPGLYGSSGDHNRRRHLREILLMDSALDGLKEKYGISSFILTGHSAGGQIVAALLNRRRDIEAAVMTSPLASVKQVSAFWEDRRAIPGRLLYDAKKFHDPVEDVERISTDPKPRIYVVSDPEDRSVPFFSQLYYVRRLRLAGLEPQHVYAHASGPSRHVLAEHGKRTAALIARGRSDAEIRRALLELDLQNLP